MKQEHYEGPERRRQAWHLDKKVPITIIVALVIQTGSMIWQASALNSAVKENSSGLAAATKRIAEIELREREGNKLVERVVRVETMLENVQHTVNRIDNALDERPRRK